MAKLSACDINQVLNRRIERLIHRTNHRGYLGLSQVGHECTRYLWLVLHDAYRGVLTPRTLRIFERGNWEEGRIIKDLKALGATVMDEQAAIHQLGGHLQGHIDGIVNNLSGVPDNTLLEFKTVNSTSFSKFSKKSLKDVSPMYYAQVQMYMHYLSLEQALFVVVNKDTEMRHFSLIEYNKDAALKLEEKIYDVFGSDSPPKKIGGPDWYVCKMCSMYDLCHEQEKVHICCRSCANVELKLGSLGCKKGVTQDTRTIDIGCLDAWESCLK